MLWVQSLGALTSIVLSSFVCFIREHASFLQVSKEMMKYGLLEMMKHVLSEFFRFCLKLHGLACRTGSQEVTMDRES